MTFSKISDLQRGQAAGTGTCLEVELFRLEQDFESQLILISAPIFSQEVIDSCVKTSGWGNVWWDMRPLLALHGFNINLK